MSKHDQKHVLLSFPRKDGICCESCRYYNDVREFCIFLDYSKNKSIDEKEFYCSEWLPREVES